MWSIWWRMLLESSIDLLQLTAAALLATFGDEKLAKDISLIHQLLTKQDLDVSIYSGICCYVTRHKEVICHNDRCFKELNCMTLFLD